MNWIKRALRPWTPTCQNSAPSPRVRLNVDALEDRCVPASGIIGGNVFYDANHDGLFQTSEFAFPGATVTLTGTTDEGQNVNVTTTSGTQGRFRFFKLEPGAYSVSTSFVDQLQSPLAAPGTVGGVASGSQLRSITLQQGQVDLSLRFGVQGLGNSEISLRSFFDNATVTDTLNLLDLPDAGTSNGVSFADNLNNVLESNVGTASLAGLVFRDVNGDGIQNSAASEPGIAGVQMNYSSVGNTGTPFIGSVVTDSSGNYKFDKITAGSYFINVTPPAGFRASGAIVGSFGGTVTRADQLVTPSNFATAAGTGYNFGLAPFTGALAADLANDMAGDDLGTVSDNISSDFTIRGQLTDPNSFSKIEARFSSVSGSTFKDIRGSVTSNGVLLITQDRLREIFGGGLPDGVYTLLLQATPASGGTPLTTSVTFTLLTGGPRFLSALPNITTTAAGTDTTILLAGTFTDTNQTNSEVVFTILDGTIEKTLNLELFDREAPRTVANFFNYLDRYEANGGTIFHRLHLENGLRVLQAGGFNFNDSSNTINTTHITVDPTIRNEFSDQRPNERGTLATAKTSGDPNGISSEFFFNLDNADAKTLDVNNTGGFTVFGKVKNQADLDLLDLLAQTPVSNQTAIASTFSELPLKNSVLNAANVLRIKDIAISHRVDELVYTVTSSNTAVATATLPVPVGGIQDTRLVINPATAGTTTITVTATDLTGHATSTSFLVTVT